MKKIYCDNAATSYPKAPLVGEAMLSYINSIGCNVNRGSYSTEYQPENIVYETRELLCKLFNFDKPENTVFTQNVTTSLNTVLKGLLKPGDNVIVSSMEHNAVMRPLARLQDNHVTVTTVNCNLLGEIELNDIEKAMTDNTKAVVVTHVSNVCGTILPVREIGALCKKHNKIFIVDAAQSAGILDIDMEKDNIDILCFTGHKGLLGPQGIGGFLIKDSIVSQIKPFIEGETGSDSELEVQSNYMPDKFESGTLNIPGIFGLNESLKYVTNLGIKNIYEEEMSLTKKFLEEVKNIDESLIVGKKDLINRSPIVSLNFKNIDNGLICYNLEREYGILTRSGLQSAPIAHKTLDTFSNGTLRFSFGFFNTIDEIDHIINSLYMIYIKQGL
ncbi:aminotransferase class V-fold PLP-dependent enzyme [Romboutsia maritimum]|uniref:cysteine desulfurase n=1 Tax=Romboutsia maritimum TaxID=2020948 RepID=A0A371IVS1_9FIRM|nr:aminotransferase class V-fold PLP-dependent enzyme [Romboutsia maritimum]RDY24580.1 aminotransferase class V-fold PLP-dependent enzyme [Romboutsia maritimum]